MSWSVLGRALRLAFFLRVPVCTLVVLAGLGPLALNSSFLGNLLDQGLSAWYLFTVSFSAFLLAFTAVTTLNLTLYYGNDRFDEGATLHLAQRRPLLTFLLGCGAAVILDCCVYWRTIPRAVRNSGFLALGFLCAVALVVFAKVVQLALTNPQYTPHPPPFLVFPAYVFPGVERVFDRIYCWSSKESRAVKGAFARLSQWPLEVLRPAGQGYLVGLELPPGDSLKLRSGHVFALSLSTIAFVAYLSIGLGKSRITAADAKVPALAFVLLFLIVACWALSALTFFFDRYRFPLLWTLAAFSVMTSFVPQSDHFFRVETRPFPEPMTAAEYMRQRVARKKRLVLVATPGGGIQAAAWTAEALTELNTTAPGFRESVALISSVSGGSLGAMIYAASFDHKIHENEVPGNARRSAIDEVAWGWTVPDLWRAILPWFRIDRTVDRGWALEKKWAAINNLDDSGGSAGTMLSDWSEAARNGTVPALVMNAMLVERGQPVVFSTTRFPAHRDQDNRIMNFYDLDPDRYRQYDIRVNTAARLSASFPYVAPASRPNLDAPYGKGFHVVDGGYYDNFGITTLLAWLNEALADAEVRRELADILILQIRHFNPKKLNDAQTQGWGFQIAAPPFALANMRDFAQDSVARNQLEFFGKYYEEKKVNVWQTSIAYTGVDRCADTPLSWKLDQDQQHCITGAWDAVLKDQTKALRCIDSYVHGRDLGVDCARAAQGKE